MSDPLPHARSFGQVAAAYDRGRPSYPRDVAAWMCGGPERGGLTVLEVGAGTGKLTEQLVALGHVVHATDPDEQMVAVLRERLPQVRTSVAGAEELPAADRGYDVVVSAQSFHWFDHDRALPELARVLKPGGHLALVWHQRDVRIPWVRKLSRILGPEHPLEELTRPLADSDLFADAEEQAFKHWQVLDRETILDYVASLSTVAVLGEAERESVLADVLALYDDYGRGMDGMQLPHVTSCFRAQVRPQAAPPAPARQLAEAGGTGDDVPPDPPWTVTTGSMPRIEDEIFKAPRSAVADDDNAMLLIDFR
ncbi:Ubiquinone/menaquinone biosynthesis C-methyltransferase UbiE [Nocardioides dokdonensis FR1436]|uniref:Ubiquinone/menaquinone biosynthesis C-methyltransferase UbiE n=1 Tax=Nocardioides dokdonensis FR1436 TaxID=1300347 RepID=A0A1A9GI58_9ACTN|nr:class I SAM-dependent methyltransferase [Nocardioides dokdonensis]ANH37997.1 Ubiquinone/menaquinone biosynthesis C-methyltransferase UbiE [Nocardioides dokdonensis FR1436]